MRSHSITRTATTRGLPILLRAVSIVALLALGGCMVGPKFAKPNVAIPDSWSQEGNTRIATQKAADSLWWKAFQDPTLDQLVELAYRQNLPLQVAGLRIVEARAQLGVATGRKYPQVQVSRGNATVVQVSERVALFRSAGLKAN